MRNILTFGAISLAMAAGVAACGDDDGDTPSTGNGGTAGRGGTGGAGGTAGIAGSAGAPGGNGGGGAGGAAPLPPIPTADCTGCVQLTVSNNSATPPAGATQNQAGFIFVAAATAAPFDISEVDTITWRIQALTNDAGYFVQPFAQNGAPEDTTYAGFFPPAIALTAAAFPPGEWRDVIFDVAAIGAVANLDAGADGGDASTGEPDPVVEVDAGDGGVPVLTGYSKDFTRQIGVNLGSTPAGALGWVSIQVDSVTVAGGASNFTSKTFDAGLETLQLNNYQVPASTPQPAPL
jgi:hypothetical protein